MTNFYITEQKIVNFFSIKQEDIRLVGYDKVGRAASIGLGYFLMIFLALGLMNTLYTST